MTPFTTAALAAALAMTSLAPASLAGQQVRPEEQVQTLILSPEPGERVARRAAFVAVSVIDPAGVIDPDLVTLEVGGRDVTVESEIAGGVVTWRPREPLASGPHRAELVLRDRTGRTLAPTSWTFSVAADDEIDEPAVAARPGLGLPGSMRGSLIVDGYAQSVSGEGADLSRNEDFLPRVWMTASGTIRPGWRYGARVHMSGYESSDRQPVNRYRIDLRTPMLDLGAGDVNPILHDLILSGRRVRGVQADLRAGPARLTVVTGQTRRGISAMLDPEDPTRVARSGTHEQNLFAVRPAIGSGRVFQAGVTMLQVRDDVNSIPELRVGEEGDSRPTSPAPKDNLVMGSDVSLRLFSGNVLVRYENAISLLANDITGGPMTREQLDSLLIAAGQDPFDFDPARYERFIILNGSLIPLDPRDGSSIAHQLRTSVRAGSHMLSAEWRSIGGSYHTLGSTSQQRDRQGFRIRDSFTMLDNAMVISAGFERDRDNLDGIKSATTHSTGIFANLAWQASHQAPLLIGTVRVGSRENDLEAGQTGARDERNLTLSAGVSYPVRIVSALNTRLNLNVSVITREDDHNEATGTRDHYILAGVQGETHDRRSHGMLTFGFSRAEFTGFEHAETRFTRMVASGRHQLNDRWAGLLNGSFTGARSPEEAGELGIDYNRMEMMGGGEFTWTPAAVFTVTGGLISYSDNRLTGRDTRELVARIRINQYF